MDTSDLRLGRPADGRVALVTGATGFIGRTLASYLADRGWRVRCPVRPESTRTTPDTVERIAARLKADELVACGPADLVVHLAALTKARNLNRFTRVNVEGTREVAEAARRLGARLVHVSSQAVAGPATSERPSVEDDPPNPLTSYAISKRLAEDVVRGMPELRWTILRPSGVYGGGDRAFLPLFRLARMGVCPIVGDAIASYTLVHVDDAVRAIEMVAGADAALGQVFFVGHGIPVSQDQLMTALAHACGRRHRPVRVPRALIWAATMVGEGVSRAGWPQNLDRSRWRELCAPGFVCSVAKATRLLGFEAGIDLAEGVSRTMRWYVEHGWLGPARRRPAGG